MWLYGCASTGSSPATWSELPLLGSTLTLVSTSTTEQLRFSDERSVAITGGPKGGPFTEPIMGWRAAGTKLEIGYPDGYDTLELVSHRPGGIVSVRRRSGAVVEFQVSR